MVSRATEVSAITSEVTAEFRCRLLNVEPTGQKCELWCWAASTEMIMRFLRGADDPRDDIEQGRQMNRRLGGKGVDCTSIETAEEYRICNGRGGWPYFFEFEDTVQSTKWSCRRHVLEERGITGPDGRRRRVKGRLSSRQLRQLTYGSGRDFKQRLDEQEDCALGWERLRELLDKDRPVFFTYRFPTTSGHMAVAAGYAVTPGARRWVVVMDPLPPGSGDVYLIPYELYVSGPHGRHWRDYWIPAEPSGSPRKRLDDLKVGSDLVRSGAPAPRPSPARKAGKKKARERGHLLTGDEIAAARPAAEEGLAAVQAIAQGSAEVAAALGMGNLLRVLLRRFLDWLVDQKVDDEIEFRQIGPGELELNVEQPVPVYELTREDLLAWNGRHVEELLRAPREIHWEITRPSTRPFPFFALVTVRKFEDGWKLFSLGRSRLMIALVLNQLFSGKLLEQLDSFDKVLQVLSSLGVVEQVLGDEAIAEATARPDRFRDQAERRKVRGGMPPVSVRSEEIQTVKAAFDEGPAIEIERPKFMLHVVELYQLFVAYSDDRLEPVYEESFYRPGSRVKAGTRREVLAGLREVAKAARRAGPGA